MATLSSGYVGDSRDTYRPLRWFFERSTLDEVHSQVTATGLPIVYSLIDNPGQLFVALEQKKYHSSQKVEQSEKNLVLNHKSVNGSESKNDQNETDFTCVVKEITIDMDSDGRYHLKWNNPDNTVNIIASSVSALHRQLIATMYTKDMSSQLTNLLNSDPTKWIQIYTPLSVGAGGEGQLGCGVPCVAQTPIMIDAGWFGAASFPSSIHSVLSSVLQQNTLSPLMGTTSRFSFTNINTNTRVANKQRCRGDIKAVACGRRHTLLLTRGGGVYSCGSNSSCQLGISTRLGRRSSPTEIPTLLRRRVSGIAAGRSHSIALTKDGLLYVWGAGEAGQLGLGAHRRNNVSTPTPLGCFKPRKRPSSIWHALYSAEDCNPDKWLESSGQYYSTNADTDGKSTGQLTSKMELQETALHVRSGSTSDHRSVKSPVSFENMEISGHVVSISAGGDTSAALTSDGALYTWGNNDFGQCGVGIREPICLPCRVAELRQFKVDSISIGMEHCLCICENGNAVFSWGRGLYGRLGVGDEIDHVNPVRVTQPASFRGLKCIQVSAGTSHSLALMENGTLFSWGDGMHGQLGDVKQTSGSLIPTQVNLPLEQFYKDRIFQDDVAITHTTDIPKISGVRAGHNYSLLWTSVVRCAKQENLPPQTAEIVGGHVFAWGSTPGNSSLINQVHLKEPHGLFLHQIGTDNGELTKNSLRVFPNVGIPSLVADIHIDTYDEILKGISGPIMGRVAIHCDTGADHIVMTTKLTVATKGNVHKVPFIPMVYPVLAPAKISPCDVSTSDSISHNLDDEMSNNFISTVSVPPQTPLQEATGRQIATHVRISSMEQEAFITALEKSGGDFRELALTSDNMEENNELSVVYVPSSQTHNSSAASISSNASVEPATYSQIPVKSEVSTKNAEDVGETSKVSKVSQISAVESTGRSEATNHTEDVRASQSSRVQEWSNQGKEKGLWGKILRMFTCGVCGASPDVTPHQAPTDYTPRKSKRSMSSPRPKLHRVPRKTTESSVVDNN